MQNKKTNNFRNILPYYIDFVIPGFEKSYPKGTFKCLSFTEQASEKWFFEFLNKVKNAIGKKFLPIYRMSDGEFQFCVGYRYPLRAANEPLWLYSLRTLRRWIKKMCFKLSDRQFSAGGKGYISAQYQASELKFLRNQYAEQLKQIAQQGILAIHFTDRINSPQKKQFQQQYFLPISRWFNKHNIQLNEKNYYPFYFVYALLTGPYRHKIYKNRHILVITSYDKNKHEATTKGLINEGVKSVQFINLSKGRSMYDKINLSSIKKPIDIVLVGAGIGASNILCQLESLNTVTIDAGYIIECLTNPGRKKQRTFCWPDNERNGNYHPI